MSVITQGSFISKGDAVTFEIEQGDKGPRAVKVAKA